MTVRPDGYVQDLASQWVTAAVAAGAPATGRPGGSLDLVRGAGRQGDRAGLRLRAATVAPARLDGRRRPTAGGGPRPRRPPGRGGPDNAGRARPRQRRRGGRRRPAPAAARPGAFDRVLVDAPCSGLGVLRRRPDARWRIQPADVGRLAALQRRLLEAALPLVRPGGLLVYSVCTLTRAETAGIDRWLARGPSRGPSGPAAARAGLGPGRAGAPGCCRRRPAPTACSCWPCGSPGRSASRTDR